MQKKIREDVDQNDLRDIIFSLKCKAKEI